MGGLDSPGWVYFKKLFKEGFEVARKHSDSLIGECGRQQVFAIL
jgi:phosphatidylinositol 4-kinase